MTDQPSSNSNSSSEPSAQNPRREAPQGRLPARRDGAEGDGSPEESLSERTRTPALEAKRKIKHQATSAVAYTAEHPSPDDPLLDFTPVPHKQLRRNSITPELQREFIAHLAATGIVTSAARHIGKSMEAIYRLRQRPGAEGFRAAWEAAIDRGVSRLEDCALARAIEGEERMVVSSGQLIGTERRHNEALVMFFLRNRRADRYGTAELRPGHPEYERLREEIREELAAEERAAARSPQRMQEIGNWLLGFKERWRNEWEAEKRSQERSDDSKP